MRPTKVIQIAWKGLAKNKLRSLLTMLGVIIGVSAVIIMIAISSGVKATIEEQITSLGSNLIFVQATMTRGGFGPGGGNLSQGLTYDDAYAIADEVNGVKGMVVEMNTSQNIKAGNITIEDVSVLGTTTDFPSVRDMDIAAGRYINQVDVDRGQEVVVLGSNLAEELFGDNTVIGQVVNIGNVKHTIVGVFKEKGQVGDTDYDSRAYIPITVIFEKYVDNFMARVVGDRVRLIYVELEENAILEDVILQIELLLAKRHDVSLEEPDFMITTQQDIIQTQEATTEAFRNLLAWVAAVSLLVGGIGIMNIMLVSVTERTREIGIRQAIGASPNDVRWQFLTEALLLSLVGGLIGVFTGIVGSWIFNIVGTLRTVVVSSSIVLAFSSAAAVGIFFGFYPANKAAQLDPIEALRHE